jgi:hypothetical protein
MAQGPYGRIVGRIVDSTGATVVGATVRVTNTESNVATNAASDSQGNYEARNLIPGHYVVVVESQGFKHFQRGPIEVRVGDVLPIDIGLELGAVTENVTVTDEAPLLDAATASVGQLVDRDRLMSLPMPSSNPMYLMALVPGVVQTVAPSGNWQVNQFSGSSSFSSNGAGTMTSEFTVDGVPAMMSYGMAGLILMPEVLQEFRMQTAAYDASQGHFTGSQVNMVTKSGTNTLHSTMTYQYNGRFLNTVPFFANQQIHNLSTGPVTDAKINQYFPQTRLNRERGVLSGPVYIPKLYDGRNRTFFMFGVDLFSRSFVPSVTSLTVPTPAQRSGDFSALLALGSQYQIYDPATIAPAGNGRYSRQPLPGNIIPASRIDAVAKSLLNYYPLPNTAGTINGLSNYIGNPVNGPNHKDFLGRLDQVVNANNRFFLSIQHTEENTRQQATSGFQEDILGHLSYYPGFLVTVDDVWSPRSDLVLDLRGGLNRLLVDELPESLGFNLQALGLPSSLLSGIDGSLTSLPPLNISNYTAIGSNSGSSQQNNFYYFMGNVAYNRGDHSIRAGAEYRVYQENTSNYGNVSPSYAFGTTWTAGPVDNSPAAPIGQGLASFLLGLPTGGSINNVTSAAQQSRYVALFLQDDWKVSRKLTLNLGMRYELELPTTERYNRFNRGFDLTVANPIQAAAQANFALNPVAGVNQLLTPGGLLFAGVNGVPRGLWNSDTHAFAPRFGFAYALSPKTVVRGGYGIFFESLGIDRYAPPQQGFTATTTLVPSNDNGMTFVSTLENPFPNGLLQPAGAAAGLATYLGQNVTFFAPQREPGYVQRWSLNLQRELPKRVLVEIGYVGNRATGLPVTQDLDALPAQYLSRSLSRDQAMIDYLSAAVSNPFYGLPAFAGTSLQTKTVPRAQLLLPYPQFTDVSTTLSEGISWYHALEARIEKRISNGLTIQASYTMSKLMEAITKLNASDPGPAHSISSLDRPQRIVVSGIYELPFGKGKRFLQSSKSLDYAVGGWSLQAIYQAQGGAPLTFGNVIYTGDLHNIALSSSQRSLSQWFNVQGFNTNSQQQLSYNLRTFPLALSGVRIDGVNNWDMSLFKTFKIREKVDFQLRAEAQDALNHPQFAAPNTTPTSTLFGQVTSTVAAQQRIILVGARLMW